MATSPSINVIIPTLNEEETIQGVVSLAYAHPAVSEVLVVDDKSVDATAARAHEAGATVITSTKLGKGASMRDGLLVAKGEIVLFLDADIADYSSDIIERLSAPLVAGEADFVKSTFTRQAGRVTELVARPLLSLLFPPLLKFSQPLSGMVAGRRELLVGMTLEDDYGVDIGLLIDMHLAGARIAQVDIGTLSNKMQQWQRLGRMSREVARAILKRASTKHMVSLDDMQTITVIRDQMEFAIRESLADLRKMAILDMDGTILRGRFIETAAEQFGFSRELVEVFATSEEPYMRTKQIALHLKGRNIAEIIAVIEGIPIVENTADVVAELHRRGYLVGIISDSYDCVVNHIKTMIGADFALANELEFSNSVCTGEVRIPSFFLHRPESKCRHTICKSNAMIEITSRYGIDLANVVAVGDSEPDICMVRFAGIGVAFCSDSKILNAVADFRVDERSFSQLLRFAE